MPANNLHTLTICGKCFPHNIMRNYNFAAYNHSFSSKSLQTRCENAETPAQSAKTSCRNGENQQELPEKYPYKDKKPRQQKPVDEIFHTFMPEKNNTYLKKEKSDMETGLKHTSETTVCEQNFARTVGSGDLPVFATPAMAALMENAAMLAVAEHLPEGSTTVGSLIETTHIRPSGEGEKVSATAVLTSIEGRKLTFKIEACDSKGTIGEATHIRYIVDREKFMSKL